TGTELIRRKGGGEAYAVTTPLIKKADGTKFGKTAGGSIWLDSEKTSPYEYYQYWLNASDADAENFIKIFTLMTQEEINNTILEHKEAPHLRVLQKALAEDITIRTHGEDALKTAIAASKILFGKSTSDDLKLLSEKDFFAIFNGVPQAKISKSDFENGIGIIDALAGKTGFLKSNGEARRELKGNSISVNKEKVNDEFTVTKKDLINEKYVLLGKGKKNNYILIVE
ncbi:tyrosine--tRNA ligase, partial [Crocinitomicaceae bacterium]|nr:tyrosine--tRNA ligase [Crocinitomicaceae bacterium]